MSSFFKKDNVYSGEPNLDFVVEGPVSYEYVDVKNPIDPRKFPLAKKKGPKISQNGPR